MGGALIELVAYGYANIYLTGNPQITLFKVVYKRHTNFAMEMVKEKFKVSANLRDKSTCIISRKGDLLHETFLFIDETLGSNFSNNHSGNLNIQDVEIIIGGKLIDKQYGVWMECWNELTQMDYKKTNAIGSVIPVNSYISNQDNSYQMYDGNNGFLKMSGNYGIDVSGVAKQVYMYNPLQFWFCRYPGLALPIVSLQNSEIKFNVTFRDTNQISGTTTLNESFLYCNYIYLDIDERLRFSQNPLTYLIEQLQVQNSTPPINTTTTKSIDLKFKHPCKELIWCVTPALNVGIANTAISLLPLCDGFTISKNDGSTVASTQSMGVNGNVKLTLNGNMRFKERAMSYFTRVQPHQHHTNVPTMDRIGVYSFALNPEQHQPSGTCNFSNINNVKLDITMGNVHNEGQNLYIFATNYNVFKIDDGYGYVLYNN